MGQNADVHGLLDELRQAVLNGKWDLEQESFEMFGPLTDFESDKYVDNDRVADISDDVSDVPVMMIDAAGYGVSTVSECKAQVKDYRNADDKTSLSKQVQVVHGKSEVEKVQPKNKVSEIRDHNTAIPADETSALVQDLLYTKPKSTTIMLQSNFTLEGDYGLQFESGEGEQNSHIPDSELCESDIVEYKDLNPVKVTTSVQKGSLKANQEAAIDVILKRYLGGDQPTPPKVSRAHIQMVRSMDVFSGSMLHRSVLDGYQKNREPVSNYLKSRQSENSFESGSEKASEKNQPTSEMSRPTFYQPDTYQPYRPGSREAKRPMFSSMAATINQWQPASFPSTTQFFTRASIKHQPAMLRLRSSSSLTKDCLDLKVPNQASTTPVLASAASLISRPSLNTQKPDLKKQTYSKFLSKPTPVFDADESLIGKVAKSVLAGVGETDRTLKSGIATYTDRRAENSTIQEIQKRYSQASMVNSVKALPGLSSNNIDYSIFGYLQSKNNTDHKALAQPQGQYVGEETFTGERIIKETVIKLPKKSLHYQLAIPKDLDRQLDIPCLTQTPIKATPIDFNIPSDNTYRQESNNNILIDNQYQTNTAQNKVTNDSQRWTKYTGLSQYMKSSLSFDNDSSEAKKRPRSVSFNLDNSGLMATPQLSSTKVAIKSILKNKGFAKQGHSKYLEFEKKYSSPSNKEKAGLNHQISNNEYNSHLPSQAKKDPLCLNSSASKHGRCLTIENTHFRSEGFKQVPYKAPMTSTAQSPNIGWPSGKVTKVTTYGPKEAAEKFGLPSRYYTGSKSFFTPQKNTDFRSGFLHLTSPHHSQNGSINF